MDQGAIRIQITDPVGGGGVYFFFCLFYFQVGIDTKLQYQNLFFFKVTKENLHFLMILTLFQNSIENEGLYVLLLS